MPSDNIDQLYLFYESAIEVLPDFFSFFFCQSAFAVFELSGSFGYKKQKYGENREDSTVEQTYSAALAIYLFSLTAVELSYFNSQNTITAKQDADSTQSFSLIETQNRVQTDVYGIGIRQALATRKSRIRPMISIGYAKQFVNDSLDYTFQKVQQVLIRLSNSEQQNTVMIPSLELLHYN